MTRGHRIGVMGLFELSKHHREGLINGELVLKNIIGNVQS